MAIASDGLEPGMTEAELQTKATTSAYWYQRWLQYLASKKTITASTTTTATTSPTTTTTSPTTTTTSPTTTTTSPTTTTTSPTTTTTSPTTTTTSPTTTTTSPTTTTTSPTTTSGTPVNTAGIANTLQLKNPAGAQSNYPLQFGRAFRAAEVASGQCPEVVYKGVTLPTQADVKNRWADGSVKFAVVSVVLPSIGAGESAQVALRAGACGSATGLTREQMLASNFDFDARIALNGGGAGSASAREMIGAGSYRLWTQGPVVTTAIVEDHQAKRYDMGTDGNKSLRPVYHVQFWPQINAYKVRAVLEQSDTTKLQNQTYSVTLTRGQTSPATVYQKASVNHVYGSRWTKEFWGGARTDVPLLGVQHNVGYLASTYAIPNYDSRITVASNSRSALLSAWSSTSKDLYDAGLWSKYMPGTGGRPDIGLFPSWHVVTLYDGDAGLWQAMRQQTDLAGAWPMHFRTGDARVFDTTSGTAGQGRVATRDSHPTQFLRTSNNYMNGGQTAVGDRFAVVGTKDSGGWEPDASHLPDPWYLMYLTTGEWWYLEQLQFWAAWGLFNVDPGSALYASGRDPRDTVIYEQLRGMAWLLRTRARAAWASVDGTPEKAYFTRAVEQALRVMEGKYIGTGSDPIRAWWAANGPLASNPLRYFDAGDAGLRDGITASDVATGDSPWMHSMLLQALGHTKELGFGAGEVLSWASQSWIKMILESDGRHLADYRMPVKKTTGGFFQTWADAFDGWTGWQSEWDSNLPDLEHGYSLFATAAVSFLAGEPNGAAAWNWVNTNGYSRINWATNPKMAIVPR